MSGRLSNEGIEAETTLAQVERILGLNGVQMVALGWNGEEYSCRLRCRRSKKTSYGLGKSIASALSDAYDEMVVEVRKRASAR